MLYIKGKVILNGHAVPVKKYFFAKVLDGMFKYIL